MGRSCQDIRGALASCLQNSDCVMIDRHKAGDCLRPPLRQDLPTQCQQLIKAYADCKRGMVDMRKRFRGSTPVALSAEIEGGKGYQLYAGKPAFTSEAEKRAAEERKKKEEEEE